MDVEELISKLNARNAIGKSESASCRAISMHRYIFVTNILFKQNGDTRGIKFDKQHTRNVQVTTPKFQKPLPRNLITPSLAFRYTLNWSQSENFPTNYY